MKTRRIVGSSLTIALGVAFWGCQSPTPPAGAGGDTVTATTAMATATAIVVPAPSGSAAEGSPGGRGMRDGRGVGRGRRNRSQGVAARLLDQADDIELTEEQKTTVEGIQKDARPEPGSGEAAWKDLHAEIVAGVKAGKLDTGKIAANMASLGKALQASLTKEAEALNALHAALEPEQRKAVVAAVRAEQAKQAARAEKRAEHAGEKDPPQAAAERNKKKLDRVTTQLDLDAAQQKKVEAILAKDRDEAMTPAAMKAAHGETKKQHDAALSAFEADVFDAKKLEGIGGPATKNGRGPLFGEVSFLTQLLPVLRPEQREKLAASMDRPWGMGRPGDHPGGHRFGFFENPPGRPSFPSLPAPGSE